MKKILGNLNIVLCIGIVISSLYVIFSPNATLHSIGILCGFTAILIVLNSMLLNGIDFIFHMKEDFKMVEFQNLILSDLKSNNTQVVNLVKNQADLLTKMTAIAVDNTVPKTNATFFMGNQEFICEPPNASLLKVGEEVYHENHKHVVTAIDGKLIRLKRI